MWWQSLVGVAVGFGLTTIKDVVREKVRRRARRQAAFS